MSSIKMRNEQGQFVEAPIFQGSDGKSAYQAAVQGGYTGTESDYNSLMADIPDTESVLSAM